MSNRTFIILLCLAFVVYGLNLRIDIMQVDAAQYAEMSWEMLVSKSFLQVHCLLHDYLDKPPLIFWLNSLSFAVFGSSNFAYKFPSFLFALLAVYSTYRFTKIYYDEQTGRTAAVILATTQALFLITNDVRTDTLLMGSVIFSIWQLTAFFEYGKTRYLLLGATGVGLAMLAKGPIGIVAPVAALAPQIIWQRNWKKLLDYRIIFGILLVALILLPMCLGLNRQFGFNGLKFYFWTQSFGRITGESQWNNHPDTFFLVHSTAWAFMPWSLFLFVGWLKTLIVFVKDKFSRHSQREIISLSGFTLILFALSLSKYQLPHYIFVSYPLAAVIAAQCCLQSASWGGVKHWITVLQVLMLTALIPLSFLLQYLFMGLEPVSLFCLIALYPFAIWSAIKLNGGYKNYYTVSRYLLYRFRSFYNRISGKKKLMPASLIFSLDIVYRNLFTASALIFITFNFLLSAFYFPQLLKYQPQNDFGRYVKTSEAGDHFVCYGVVPDFALIFYAGHVPVDVLWDEQHFKELLSSKLKLIVYASQTALDELRSDQVPFRILEKGEMFPITQLNVPFLNPITRDEVCDKVYLLEVAKE